VRWLADECLDARIAAWLAQAGHDIRSPGRERVGATDREILALSLAETRLLLTEDKDFGELVIRRGLAVPGLLLLRVASEDAAYKIVRLQAAIEQHGSHLFGALTVVDERRVRRRLLKSDTPS
jgi:predicted nuclease of predicted toxin-antitoxin system